MSKRLWQLFVLFVALGNPVVSRAESGDGPCAEIVKNLTAAIASHSDDQADLKEKLSFCENKKNYFYRFIGGYTGAIGRSAAPKGQYYFEVSASTPLNDSGKDQIWGYIRVAAAPQQVDAPIQTFVAELPANVGAVNINKIGHSGEFLIGWEHRIKQTLKPFYLSPILAFGSSTPINPEENISVYQVDDAAIKQRYPEAVGKQYIAFVPPQRDGAYFQYQAGMRFTTLSNAETAAPESTLDLTVGQNQAITQGRFHGAVLRFDGMVNLTEIPKLNLPIYLFATGMFRVGSSNFSNPLVLAAAPAGISVPGNNVAIVTTPPSSLDLTRFGIGVDFARIFTSRKN